MLDFHWRVIFYVRLSAKNNLETMYERLAEQPPRSSEFGSLCAAVETSARRLSYELGKAAWKGFENPSI